MILMTLTRTINDSKSEVNHKMKVNDEPQQKKTRKRRALDTAEDE